MNNNYPTNADPRPKRRRDKDNPYELYTIGMDTEHPRYFVEFTDGQNRKHCEEISRELYELLDSFELEDLSYMNECDRHRIKVSLSDVLIHQCADGDRVYAVQPTASAYCYGFERKDKKR